jgi:hypothetical protein
VLLLEPVDTLDGETNGTGSVAGRRYTSLESVTESNETRVEELLALFSENVGDDFSRVSLRSLLRAALPTRESARRRYEASERNELTE